MAGFDPYQAWLDIPLAERPANYYRLLAVHVLEHDPDVIRAAAERTIAHVARFASGDQAAICQQIQSELGIARDCLLDPARKAQYDARLGSQPGAASSTIQSPPPVPGASAAAGAAVSPGPQLGPQQSDLPRTGAAALVPDATRQSAAGERQVGPAPPPVPGVAPRPEQPQVEAAIASTAKLPDSAAQGGPCGGPSPGEGGQVLPSAPPPPGAPAALGTGVSSQNTALPAAAVPVQPNGPGAAPLAMAAASPPAALLPTGPPPPVTPPAAPVDAPSTATAGEQNQPASWVPAARSGRVGRTVAAAVDGPPTSEHRTHQARDLRRRARDQSTFYTLLVVGSGVAFFLFILLLVIIAKLS